MLIRSFINLSKFDPDTVAQAFLEKIKDHLNKSEITIEESSDDEETISENDSDNDSQSKGDDSQNKASSPPVKTSDIPEQDETPTTKITKRITKKSKKMADKSISIEFLQAAAEFDILFQFCYLCSKEKIKSISYSIQETQDTTDWQQELKKKFLCPKRSQNILIQQALRQSNSIDEDELTIDSTLSLKDRHMIHTLLKISENLDQNTLRLTKETEEKQKVSQNSKLTRNFFY